MANRAELAATVQRHILPGLIDEYFDSHVYLNWMLNRGRVVERDADSSQRILKDKLGLTKAYDGYDSIAPSAKPDTVTDADYPMAHWVTPVQLPWTRIWKTRGPASVMDEFVLMFKEAQLDMDEKFSDELWTNQDASSSTLLGIPRITSATASHEVGGLDTDAVSVWAPINRAASGSSNALVRADIDFVVAGTTYGMDGPKLALMNRASYVKVLGLFEAQEEFTNHDQLSAGFRGVTIIGVPHFIDPKATGSGAGQTDNTITYLNDNYLELAYDPNDFYALRDVSDKIVNQRVVAFQLFNTIQHRCSSRRHQGKIHTMAA